MTEGDQELMTNFFKQQSNFFRLQQKNLIIGSMVEIEPLLIG
jgi:hypothetical protein